MPRFVILRHTLPPDAGRPSHWDVMIEADGSLRTWAVASEPEAGQTLCATPLAAHRLEYLAYEGPLSGGRGEVSRIDEGECTAIDESPGSVGLELAGRRIRGHLILTIVEAPPT